MGFKDQAQQLDSGSSNGSDMLFKTLKCRTCSWNGITLFRPFGAPNDDKTGVLPWRKTNEPNDFTDWVCMLPNVVRMAGTDRPITFLGTPNDQLGGGESPYARMLRIIKQQAKIDANYDRLLKGEAGKGPALPGMNNLIVMQGALIQHAGKSFAENPMITVLMLPKSAGDAMREVLNTPSDLSRPDLADQFDSGDVVHPQNGKMLKFYNPEKTQNVSTTQIRFGGPPQPGSFKQQSSGFQKYAFEFEPSPEVDPAWMINEWRDWSAEIRTLSTAEMVAELSSSFKPELVAMCFRDSQFEEFVPKNIRDRYFVSGASHIGAPAARPATSGFLQSGPVPPASRPPTNSPAGMPMPAAAPTSQGDAPASPPVQTGGFKSAAAGGSVINFGNSRRDTDAPPDNGNKDAAQSSSGDGQPAHNSGFSGSFSRLQGVLQANRGAVSEDGSDNGGN